MKNALVPKKFRKDQFSKRLRGKSKTWASRAMRRSLKAIDLEEL